MFEHINDQYNEVEMGLAEFGLTLEPEEDGNGFIVSDDYGEKWYPDLGAVADLLTYLEERNMKEE